MKAALACVFALCLTVTAAGADAPAHGAGGHEAHLGHAGVDSSPSEVKGDLAIFSAVVFLLLVVILRKFAWKPIAEGLEKREHHIAHEIAAAEKANEDARHLLAEYRKKLDAAQVEVRAIIEEARRDAETTQQQIVAKAREEAQLEMNRAKREVETAKDQALKELAETAATEALHLAGKLLQQRLQPADHARLVDEALAKFPRSNANLN